MKKYAIFALIMMLSTDFNAGAQLSSTIMTDWAYLLDSQAPDIGIDMALTADDAIAYLSVVGSAEKYDPQFKIYYNNQFVATGAQYNGNSCNNNFNLIKTDKSGKMQWMVYSKSGDVFSGNGGVTGLSDGSIIASAIIRHTDNYGTTPITIVDATGKETKIDWTLESNNAGRFAQGLIIKVNAEGSLQWAKLVEASNAPQPNTSKNTSQPIYFYGIECDNNDNFYISGRYCNPISFIKVDGTKLTLTPHNTDDWNGEAQTTVGDLFVAKFNSNGYLIDYLTTEGTTTAETMAVLAKVDDDLILNFVAEGQGDISLGGKHVTIPADNKSLITARISNDFEVKWLNSITSGLINSKKPTFQNNIVNVIDNEVWLTGMGNFNIQGNVSTVSDSPREGYLFHLNSETGELLSATTSHIAFPNTTAITGFMGAFESDDADDNNIYLYGYSWNGLCVALFSLDKTTLNGNECFSLISGGSMPTSQVMVTEGNKLYTVSRGRDQDIETQYLSPVNSNIHLPTRDWAICFAAFNLPFNVKVTKTKSKLGDINDDGFINTGDISTIYSVILGAETDASIIERSKITDDNDINVGDVSALYDIIISGEN